MTQDAWNQFCSNINQVIVCPVLRQVDCNTNHFVLLGFGWTGFLIAKLGFFGFVGGIVTTVCFVSFYSFCKKKSLEEEYTKVKEVLEQQCLV